MIPLYAGASEFYVTLSGVRTNISNARAVV